MESKYRKRKKPITGVITQIGPLYTVFKDCVRVFHQRSIDIKSALDGTKYVVLLHGHNALDYQKLGIYNNYSMITDNNYLYIDR